MRSVCRNGLRWLLATAAVGSLLTGAGWASRAWADEDDIVAASAPENPERPILPTSVGIGRLAAGQNCSDLQSSGVCTLTVSPGVETGFFGTTGFASRNTECTRTAPVTYSFSSPSAGGKLQYRAQYGYFNTACGRGPSRFGYLLYTMPIGVTSETFTVTERSGLTNAISRRWTVTAVASGATIPIAIANDFSGTTVSTFALGDHSSAGTIAVGPGSRVPSIDSTTNRAFVPASTSNAVTMIDLATNTSTNLTVGSQPFEVRRATVAGSTRAYVTNQGSNSVSVIDVAQGAVTGTVAVGTSPRGTLVLSGKLWVAQAGTAASGSSVAIVDLATGTLEATISLPSVLGATAFVYDETIDRIYVRGSDNGTIAVINPTTRGVVTTVAVAPELIFSLLTSSRDTRDLLAVLHRGTAAAPGSRVYLLDQDSNTVIGSVAVGNGPSFILRTPFDNKWYVANRYSNTVTVIDNWTREVIATIPVGSEPIRLAYQNRRVYVANFGSGTVSVIDIDRDEVVDTVNVGGNPTFVVLTSAPRTATQQVAPQDGWWWNASESGRGYGFEVRGNRIFMAAYMYRDDGPSVWYVGAGTLRNGVLTAPLSEFTGGQSVTSAHRSPSLVGTPATATVTFSSGSAGTIQWTGTAFGTGSASTPVVRFPFNGTAVAPPDSSAAPETGWYWNPSEPGTGYFIEVQGSQLFMAFYAYADSGPSRWYVASGAVVSTGVFGADGNLTFTGALSAFTGGQSLTGAARTPSAAGSPGGITLVFSSPTTAQVTLPSGRQFNIQRFYTY
jgi:YVTN family beta-propeller protein